MRSNKKNKSNKSKENKILKENEKVLIAKSLLKITFIMTCVSLFLKLIGLDLLDADSSNKTLLFLANIIENNDIFNFGFTFILLFIQLFIFFRLSCKNDKLKTYFIATLFCVSINMFAQWYIQTKLHLDFTLLRVTINFICNFLLMLLIPIFIDLKIKYEIKKRKNFIIQIITNILTRIKRPMIMIILIFIYQFIVMFLRNITLVEKYYKVYDILLNFDYMILLFATYYLFLKKEVDVKLKYIFDFSLPKLFDEKPSIDSIRIIRADFKEKKEQFRKFDREEKIVNIIYIFLFVLSELFNLALIIFIAGLNHALIECLFVITSFLITRKVFGAFHFDTAWKCWVVSNTSFFILNKLTIGVGLSTAMPILCGIGLAFLTSKFIKKHITKPYRGMPEQELRDICRNKKLSKFEMDLLMDFYCFRETLVKLTYKYNFSERALYRYKSAALNKIENTNSN